MNALVTGGGGFLGRRLVELLLERGDEVRIASRRRYPDLEAAGAESVVCDVRDSATVESAVSGVDTVFHLAAKTGPWGPAADFRAINQGGTRNVLAAAQGAGVGRLVYTSTPSVVGYAQDIENGPQSLPIAKRHEAPYAATKAAAEREVLEADCEGLRTVALRPHLVFGTGDRDMLPPVVQRAREGRLRIVGDGLNTVDLTHVSNAAWAHIDAAEALDTDRPTCAGRAYFVSNGEPVRLWEWLNGLLVELGLPAVERSVSLGKARMAARGFETAWRMLPLPGVPPVTPFLVNALAHSHWYDLDPARRDLGYSVRVPMDEATLDTVSWLRSA